MYNRLFTNFTRRQILRLPVCFPAHQIPSEQGSTLKGKNLLPMGAILFLFRVDLFSKGGQNNSNRVASPESVF